MLEIRDLAVSYEKDKKKIAVMNHLNLTIEAGKILAIVGRSGCGKTTLLNTIAGIKDYEGEILFHGKEVSPRQVKIGLIPQDYGLLAWQTVLENCLFGVGYRNQEAKREVKNLMERLQIDGLSDHYPSEISGGQAQRVALCRALLMKPDILLMDEPFSALDEVVAREAQRMTLKLWQETNAVGIIITHRLEEALFIADEILVMDGSRPGNCGNRYENSFRGVFDAEDAAYFALKKKIEEAVMESGV